MVGQFFCAFSPGSKRVFLSTFFAISRGKVSGQHCLESQNYHPANRKSFGAFHPQNRTWRLQKEFSEHLLHLSFPKVEKVAGIKDTWHYTQKPRMVGAIRARGELKFHSSGSDILEEFVLGQPGWKSFQKQEGSGKPQ